MPKSISCIISFCLFVSKCWYMCVSVNHHHDNMKQTSSIFQWPTRYLFLVHGAIGHLSASWSVFHGSHFGVLYCWKGRSYLEYILYILMAKVKKAIPISQAHFKPLLPIICKYPTKQSKLDVWTQNQMVQKYTCSHGIVVPVTIPPQERAELEPITHSSTTCENSW